MLKNEVDFMKKICSSLLLLFVSLIFLFSCSDNSSDGGNDGSGSAQEPEKTYHKVMVGVGEGFTVTSKNPIDVEEGSDAVFDIAISPTHSFVSVSDGVYDQVGGKLTIPNVSKRIFVDFYVKAKESSEIGKSYVYFFEGTEKDSTSILKYANITSGTTVTVTAGDKTRNFLGWSFGERAAFGAKIVSTDRVYSFEASQNFADENQHIRIYPNYNDANKFYYDLSGGTVNTSSQTMKANEYYNAEYSEGRVMISLLDKYFNYAGCASTFWDDGSFTKE